MIQANDVPSVFSDGESFAVHMKNFLTFADIFKAIGLKSTMTMASLPKKLLITMPIKMTMLMHIFS